jgi:hypothetical protein
MLQINGLDLLPASSALPAGDDHMHSGLDHMASVHLTVIYHPADVITWPAQLLLAAYIHK